MKLRLIRHLWGVDLSHGLAPYLARWRQTGYDALEVSTRSFPDLKSFYRMLKEERLGWVPQVFSRLFEPGGSVAEHLESLAAQIEECLPGEPLFINAHSGSDTWSPAQAMEFFGRALEMEEKMGLVISHETHRLRYFATPWQTRPILEAFPDLKITADFSHWVVVCERLLPDLGETLELAAKHTHHLHARVGHEEGPQVGDPFAPEWAGHLAAHEKWWDLVWDSQARRGMAVTTLTPEFGPPNYMPTLPHTRMPVASLAEICDRMASRQAERFTTRRGAR